MYIKSIHIASIKCLRDVKLALQRPDGSYEGWTVIAGGNGTGKSTLLQAIALSLAGPIYAGSLQESFVRWVSFGNKMASSSIELALNTKEKAEIAPILKSDSLSAGFTLACLTEGSEPARHWNGETGKLLGDIESGSPNRESIGPWHITPKEWFIAGYGPFRRLPDSAFSVQAVKSKARRIAQLSSLFREDATLVESIPWLKEVYLRRLEKRPGAKELEEGVLTLLDDGLLPGGLKVDKVDSDGLWVTNNGEPLSLRDLSDGYRTVAALVLDLVRQLFDTFGEFKLKKNKGTYQADYPGVVLIDEMDAHLHVSWQQKIGFWLKNHFPKIQFIVSTHSPFICQAADPRGLIRLPGIGEDNPAEHVSEQLFNTVINGSVDEAVLTGLFGLDTPHSPRSEKIRDELAGLEVLHIRGKATAAQKERYNELKKQLPDTQSSMVQQALKNLGKTPPG
ncbi:MAG: AAA family ATPase [bacterium]|nr:AAA family ATPase [bacterium]